MRSLGPSVGVVIAVALVSCELPALAQPRKPVAQPPAPQPAAPALQPAAAVTDMMAPVPGGITAEQVGARAMQTSFAAKAAEENASAASAKADAASLNYLPRVGLLGRYTRLSDFTPPVFGAPGIQSVVTTAPATDLNSPTPIPAGTPLFASESSFRLPLALNQWLLQATIVVPISDYFLKINQAHSAALRQEEAARFDHVAARAKSYSDGKIVYFTWLRARGAQTVAEQTLAVAQAHQRDAETLFNVGNVSKADVLRAQTQVAVADLAVERAKSGVRITETQLRIAMHAKDEEKLEPGEGLDGPLTQPPAAANLKALVAEAQQQRPEIKSIDKNAEAARKAAAVSRAGRYPALSGFGDVTYANPNPRRFPQVNPVTGETEWFPTWAVGAQITWSPNDFLGAGAASSEAEARASQLENQKTVVREGVDLEVTQAYTQVHEADIAIQSTTRQLEAALEGYRVARELFNNGRGTATTMIDAETALAQARFDNLNARVDARLARIRLDHALGRDTRAMGP